MMGRDKAINVFLLFFLLSLVFVWLYPVYYTYDHVMTRIVPVSERLLSLAFISLWIALCVYAAHKKRKAILFGGATYAAVVYVVGWLLTGATQATSDIDNIFYIAYLWLLHRIFELVHAPMVGLSLIFSQEAVGFLAKLLLPALLVSYVAVALFRFYRKAYLAQQLHIEDAVHPSNPTLAKEIATPKKTKKDKKTTI